MRFLNSFKTFSFDRRILIIIVFAFLLRLFHITNPPTETSHNWRQTTSLMVARNYLQLDHNIFYPTIDENGATRGVIGMEFPVLSYSIYLVSEIGGYDHWYGRLINLVVVSVGLYFFYLLVALYFQKPIAYFATIALTFSALFHLARKVLPDPMSLSLVVIGMYFGIRFLRDNRWYFLPLYFVFACLGALVKIPFGLYLSLLAFPFFHIKQNIINKTAFALTSIALLATVYYWYFKWNVHISETFGVWYNTGRSLGEGLRELGGHLPNVLSKFYFDAFQGYIFFLTSLSGLGIIFFRKNKSVITVLAFCAPLMAVYMMKSGFLFAHHGYYALVMVPIMSLLVAHLLVEIPRKWATALLILCIIESVANQQHDFFINKQEAKIHLETIADEVSVKSDLVALVSNQNPNEFYFLNRKGWIVGSENLNAEYLLHLKAQGCQYLFMRRNVYNENLPFPHVFESQEYLVLKL